MAKAQRRQMVKFAKSLSMGIVGLPNVGKSLLFNLLAKQDLAGTANYPFCTIQPNLARVLVPDDRFVWLCRHFRPRSEVPATLNVVDIAGLVRGASKGEGLGNEFLSNIRAVNGIYQVIRIFDNPEVVHVEGAVDPVRDLTIISDELKAKDIEWLSKTLEDLQKRYKMDPKKVKEELDTCTKVLEFLQNDPRPIRAGEWSEKEAAWIEGQSLLTSKTMIFLLNMDSKSFVSRRNRWLAPVAAWIKNYSGEPIIPFCACWEDEFSKLEAAAQAEFAGESKSALPKIIKSGFHDLGLINFFTCGPDEVRGWTVQSGAVAPVAGSVIHSDFMEYFIRCDVYTYDDLVECGSEAGVKAAGKLRTEGKAYIVKDGDILFFKHGAGSGAKKK